MWQVYTRPTSASDFSIYKIGCASKARVNVPHISNRELNSGFALLPIQVLRVKLRFEVMFKKFHPRINLTTLFLTKTYILNTIQPFLGHKNGPLELKQQNVKNLS
jgi:hypothetical protein